MNASVRRRLFSALTLVGLLAAAASARAMDYAAYARMLEAHVRPGVINGVRLHVVDYQALRKDPSYAQALADFAAARPESFPSEADRFAFWINAYNLMAIKAVADQYPVKSIKDGGGRFVSIWKIKVGTVAGKKYALDDIEHAILRPVFKDPRLHSGINCASLSCPDLRPEPYVGERLDTQLDEATRNYLSNETKGLILDADGQRARVSSIFRWFSEDWLPGGVAAFIRAKAEPALAARLAALTDAGLSYLDYDWSLNDASRVK